MSKRDNNERDDQRLRDDAVQADTLRAAAPEDHPDRSTDERVAQDRELSDLELSEMFNASFYQDALPDLPDIPGFHVCWLTTTNARDTLPMRMRLGYVPVKPEDIPGWTQDTLKSGEFSGFIGVNEMLAFKIPLKLYNRIMQEYHHWAPMREQEKIVGTVDTLKDRAKAMGASIQEGDGITDMRKSVPVPSFI